MADGLPRKEVGAPAPFSAEGTEVLERVHSGRKQDGRIGRGSGMVEAFEEVAGGHGRVLGGGGPDPAGREAATGGVDGVAGGCRECDGVDA